ncbi:CDP-diacylglycerol--glycerol-3-phosphate 3-phosphatidyltransferase [Holdemania filiformis]|uniref:CDP-diacylglycerol--glycerol-3-phosphate 3-phosphatidyltransferase n=1 Tax=Holdemania filiformis TaxID=61171 RepID=A0A412G6Y1_9FIRM|nr:CDP-diacylglycerol--glycerol-3-phosphate 3-phosphatidyltransferase [Holdemania filiformis]MBS5002772.1 CDP-diacylglycerol--glycerol-3-phosphate 3-phosphatidyltransferase [Holdemania filiformis]RGR77006.1 CDP-diacylglycerol--glycerol-3-phosphate 3-phosphatidyltransferase [Holdemania filiformis]
MNLPNRLTVMRIIMIPVIILIAIFPYSQFGIEIPLLQFGFVTLSAVNIVMLVLFCVASFTDFLDGYLARKNNLVTTFGKFADPIADKLLVTTMYILFAAQGTIPVVPVLIMVARDTIVDGIRMIASSSGVVMAAGYLGKLKTVVQMLSIITILLNNLPFELYRLPVSDFLLWFAAFTSLASGISYFNQMKEYIFESK